MPEQVKGVLRCALILFVITAVIAALLAATNALTEDVIAQNSVKAENNALKSVMPEADTFTAVSDEVAQRFSVNKIYDATRQGEHLGYCIRLSVGGYGGEIVCIVGVGADGKVTGTSIISHSETPGLGANIAGDQFRDQFVGQGRVSVVKAGAADGQINAVSGATISSRAMTEAVNQAVDIAEALSDVKGAVPAEVGSQSRQYGEQELERRCAA